MEKTIANVINEIFVRFGQDILLEGDRFCSILGDMAPSMQLEIRVMNRMNQEKIFLEVYKVVTAKDTYSKNSSGKVERLLTDAGFSKEWKEIAMNAFGLVSVSSSNIRGVEDAQQQTGKKKCLGKNQARNLFPNVGEVVTIPRDYSIIGKRAFEYLGLYGGKVKKVILPETVEEIQDYAFEDIEVLDYIEIPKTVKKIGEYSPFKLGKYAYVKCEQESYVYDYCRKHNIKNSVDGIGQMLVNHRLDVEEAVKCDVEINTINGNRWSTLVISNIVSIEKGAFRNRKDIEILIIGADVKYIKQNAFKGCRNLKYVFLSDAVISIASSAFADCTSLTYIKQMGVPMIIKEVERLLREIDGEREEEFFIADTAFAGCSSVKIIVDAENEFSKCFPKQNIVHISENNDENFNEFSELSSLIGIDTDLYSEYLEITSFIYRYYKNSLRSN